MWRKGRSISRLRLIRGTRDWIFASHTETQFILRSVLIRFTIISYHSAMCLFIELSPMAFGSRGLAYHRKRYFVFLVLKRDVVRIALTASCCNRTHQPWTHPHVTYYKRCESRNSSLDFKGIRQLRTVCLYKSWYEFNGYILASYLK